MGECLIDERFSLLKQKVHTFNTQTGKGARFIYAGLTEFEQLKRLIKQIFDSELCDDYGPELYGMKIFKVNAPNHLEVS